MEEPKVDLAENLHLPLPRDLIQNILSRLPIDSLFESKLVCTSWRSLINHPDRVLPKKHYTHLAENPQNPATSLIFVEGKYHTSTNCCLWYLHDLSSTHSKKAIEGKDLPFDLSLIRGLSVVGSCNGLVCLTDALDMFQRGGEPNPNVFISNPVNGDWVQLPPSDFPKPNQVFFGFGYSPKKKEYKVLRMQDGQITGHLTADVLILGGECDTSWRRVGTNTLRDIFWDNFFGVYVNGCLHWFTVGGERFGKIVGIKTFDLDEETFGALALPQSLQGKSRADLFLGAFGGSLMIVDHSNTRVQKVWLMKDCPTWTLQFIIPTPPRQPNHISPRRPYHISSKRPLSMLENGNVLLQYDVSLLSYNPITKEHELVRVDGLPFAYTTTPHVGTLVTLEDICSMKEGPSAKKMGKVSGDKVPTSSLSTEEHSLDAASEKELGNQYFKEKKFKEAIDCYSRSIVLSPTAVAFANRAMAYLKIKRFGKAENDCTAALNLDDGYIKAYSRRATARKDLGKLKESLDDLDSALKLEPDNQELKKQYSVVKALNDAGPSSLKMGSVSGDKGPTSSSSTEERSLDAASEEVLGMEYFKEKKFKEAIGCYNRSIVLSPSAVAFANRALAYMKINRFGKAENDCTAALKLDDGYLQAYLHRATARRELGKIEECFEDLNAAMKLAPGNQVLKERYCEAKAQYHEEKSSNRKSNRRLNQGYVRVQIRSEEMRDKLFQLADVDRMSEIDPLERFGAAAFGHDYN